MSSSYMKSLSLPATKEVKMETPHCHLHTKAMRRKMGVQNKPTTFSAEGVFTNAADCTKKSKLMYIKSCRVGVDHSRFAVVSVFRMGIFHKVVRGEGTGRRRVHGTMMERTRHSIKARLETRENAQRLQREKSRFCRMFVPDAAFHSEAKSVWTGAARVGSSSEKMLGFVLRRWPG